MPFCGFCHDAAQIIKEMGISSIQSDGLFVCLEGFRRSNSISVIKRRSVFLTTLFLRRFTLSKRLTSTYIHCIVHILSPETNICPHDKSQWKYVAGPGLEAATRLRLAARQIECIQAECIHRQPEILDQNNTNDLHQTWNQNSPTRSRRPSPKFSQLVLITWFHVCGWYNQLMILVLYSMEMYGPMFINQTIKRMLLLQMYFGCILLCRYT